MRHITVATGASSRSINLGGTTRRTARALASALTAVALLGCAADLATLTYPTATSVELVFD